MRGPAQPECLLIDSSFGPWAGECRGGFDFTLLFEESILTILPSSIFLLALPFRLFRLRRRAARTRSSPLRISKVIFTTSWIIMQLSLLVVWASRPSSSTIARTRVTIPASSISFVTALGYALLSWFEHDRAVRPSLLFESYLFFSILFDTARVRTLWLMDPNSSIAIIFTCTVALRCALIILESMGKRSIMLPPYSEYPKEALSGAYSRSVFFWLTSLFFDGYRNILSLDDLFPLDKKLQTEKLHARLQFAWAGVHSKKKDGSFMYTWMYAQKWDLCIPIFWRLCLIGFTFSQPFLVTSAIELASTRSSSKSNNSGYGLIGAYALVYIGIAISNGQYYHGMNRAAIMMRGSVVPCIFNKTLRLRSSDTNSAAALSLINTDIETIMPGVAHMHELWAGLVEISIAIYLLYRQIGAACAIPISFTFFILIVTGFIAVPIGKSQAAWIESAQKRVSTTSSTLGKIQWLRMSGLDDFAFSKLQKLRDDELKVSRKMRVLTMWILTLATCTPIFSPVLTFITYSLLALRNNDTLTISKIFTSLSLFVLFSSPLSMMIVSLSSVAAAVTSFGRIQSYLNLEEHEKNLVNEENPQRKTEKSSATHNRGNESQIDTNLNLDMDQIGIVLTDMPEDAIVFIKGKVVWPDAPRPILDIEELVICRATLTIILGPVGCGKTTFLRCILGEMSGCFKGELKTSLLRSGVAYCDQTPFLPNLTIRELIVSDSEYDPKWFATVLGACALEDDLQQWENGDSTKIGTKGISLSGGQKQRLAIARAVYSRRELVILDDCFSGLDSETEARVFKSLLGDGGLLRRDNITVVLASSNVGKASHADKIVVLGENGTIMAQGSSQDLSVRSILESGALLRSPLRRSARESREETADLTVQPNREHTQSILLPVVDTHTDSRRQIGDSSVYRFYLHSTGWKAPAIFVVSMIIFTGCDSFPYIWLKWWAESNAKSPNHGLEKWLTVYAALAVGSMVFLLIGTWQVFILCITNSGVFFHDILINTTSRATMEFFTNVDLGITINRFSQDLQLIDMELPTSALGVAVSFVFCIASGVLMSVASKYFAIVIPFVFFIFYLIQHFYLRTSRQMRFLEIEHKAPLYSQLIETLHGLVTIRAFGWESSVEETHWRILNDSQRPSYLLFCLQQWLILSVNLVVASMAIILITLTTTLRDKIGPGYMGIAMINIIAFGETSKTLIQTWVGLEISIGAVARVKNYAAETPVEEEDYKSESADDSALLSENWPSSGNVEFINVTAGYSSGPLLEQINLSIAPGERIGVCGRTGSGKSSLLQTLFQMIPVTDGSIKIDDIPLNSVKASVLRNRIVAVSQEPYIFASTIRENLDPYLLHTDDSIIMTLHKVQLWETIIAPRSGLDAQIDDKFFSYGQAQLFSLARAMLRKPTILVLDEITSSLDEETERVVKKVVKDEFPSVTIIAVAHRMEFIQDFDRVVVLDRGRIVDVQSPNVLASEESRWSELMEA